MPLGSLVIFDEELKQITEIVKRLYLDANAKVVFLIDKDGQLITSSGEVKDIDTTSLATLTAGNIAATGGLAKLIGEKEFSILFHEGEKDNIHISIVGQRLILVVIFNDRSSLGLVRLRVRRTSKELNAILKRLVTRASETLSSKENLLTEITDDDIEKLFQ
jgi:predicted regulator of Ras-like GTPase activity (Roadblock/LC7/MglB family)